MVKAALVAALYVLLTLITNMFGLASGVIQVRLSEAMCILPVFFPSAIPGLFIGCMMSNFFTGCVLIDVIFGSIATLIGAIGTRLLRSKPYLAVLPPILSNAVIVPFVLKYAYGLGDAWWFMACTVGAGEVISCGVLGLLLYFSLKKHIKHD